MSSDVLRFDASAARIEVPAGSRFVIELSAQPTAGYLWRVTGTPAIVLLEDDQVHPHSKQLGSGATQELRFLAHKKGREQITLSLGRSWEEKAAQTWQPTIVVT